MTLELVFKHKHVNRSFSPRDVGPHENVILMSTDESNVGNLSPLHPKLREGIQRQPRLRAVNNLHHDLFELLNIKVVAVLQLNSPSVVCQGFHVDNGGLPGFRRRHGDG